MKEDVSEVDSNRATDDISGLMPCWVLRALFILSDAVSRVSKAGM